MPPAGGLGRTGGVRHGRREVRDAIRTGRPFLGGDRSHAGERMNVEAVQRAAAYVRVSQERNARDGYGLDAQEADVRRFAEYKRLALVEVYREEGASGYERDRPELERLIADATTGRWDVAVFPSIDRAGRSVKDVIEIDRTLRKAGVDVAFVRESVDTTTAVGEFFTNVMASLAQLEGQISFCYRLARSAGCPMPDIARGTDVELPTNERPAVTPGVGRRAYLCAGVAPAASRRN